MITNMWARASGRQPGMMIYITAPLIDITMQQATSNSGSIDNFGIATVMGELIVV